MAVGACLQRAPSAKTLSYVFPLAPVLLVKGHEADAFLCPPEVALLLRGYRCVVFVVLWCDLERKIETRLFFSVLTIDSDDFQRLRLPLDVIVFGWKRELIKVLPEFRELLAFEVFDCF